VIAVRTIAGRPLSRIVLGCEPLGGTDWGTTDSKAATAAVEEAVTCGITAFDVADVYGLGRAEMLLGQVLGGRTADLLVMTKGGVRWWESRTRRARIGTDGSAGYLRQAVEASLERLHMDSIPLYFLHRPDPNVPIEESVGALGDLVDAGLLGAIGVCNMGPAEVRRAHAVHSLAAVQFEYSLLKREAEAELLPVCRELGIPALAYGPLAQGLLTGKYSRQSRFGNDDRRQRLPLFAELAKGDHDQVLERLRAIAQKRGASQAQLALSWILSRPGIAAVIAGAKNADQVRDNAGSIELRLDAQDHERIDLAAAR
jgi:aryl-alcohol dehydrogenase-like predicted oxidoreductase